MGHIPEDDNFEEYMNASAEEWSKPSETPPEPDLQDEHVDRWGSPIPENGTIDDAKRWGSEAVGTSKPNYDPQMKKSGSKWWIIVVVILVVLCLCACIALVGLPYLGYNLFQSFPFQF